MTTIHDPAFGVMSYDFLWEKQEQITLWGKEYTLRIEARAETEHDSTISAPQQQAYLQSRKLLELEQNSCLNTLCNYCKEVLGVECSSEEFLHDNHPTSLFFALGGNWGLLFDSPYDEENGIALIRSAGNWSAGPQDVII